MKLAELVIDLIANTASLQRDFDKAHRQAEEFVGKMQSALAGIGLGVGITGLGEAINQLVDYEDQMSHTAQAAGMTTAQMVELTEQLKVFDVPTEQAAEALAYFDKIMSGLVRSKAGQTAIKELGLSFKDLQKLSPNDQLLKVADAFSKLKDGADKAGMSAALFGTTYGFRLLPWLDQGAETIRKNGEQFASMANMVERAAGPADEFKRSWVDLESQLKGVGAYLGSYMLPYLASLSEEIAHPVILLKFFGDAFEIVFDEIGKAGAKLGKFLHIPFVESVKDWDKSLADAKASMDKNLDALTRSMLAAEEKMKASLDVGASDAGSKSAGGSKSHANGVASAIRQIKEELEGLSEGRSAKSLQHLKDLGASPSQLAQANALLNQIASIKSAKAAQQDYNDAFKEYAALEKTLYDATTKLTAAQKDYIAAVMKINEIGAKGIDVHKGLALAQDKYRQQVMKDNPMFSGGAVPMGGLAGTDMFMNAANVPALSLMKKMQAQAQTVGQTMSSMFEGMTLRGESFKQMLTGITEQLAEFLLKATVFNTLANVFGTNEKKSSGGLSGLLAGFFSGLAGRASGGPVTAGSLYMVGENGPELFAPGASGSIIPNGGGGASRASGSTVNIDARGADAGVEARIARAMDAMGKKVLGQSLVMNYEYQARGGQL